jgi:hypothetical protein
MVYCYMNGGKETEWVGRNEMYRKTYFYLDLWFSNARFTASALPRSYSVNNDPQSLCTELDKTLSTANNKTAH